MPSPFIFIATNRLKAGQLDRERKRVPGLVEFIEANEPRLIAFNEFVNGEPKYFFELVNQVPDGEKDLVAVLKPEDLPLLRRVRRKFISAANPHASEYYGSFTKILLTFVLRTETLK